MKRFACWSWDITCSTIMIFELVGGGCQWANSNEDWSVRT